MTKQYKVDYFDSFCVQGPTKYFNTEEEAYAYANTAPVPEKVFGRSNPYTNFFIHKRVGRKWYVLKRIERKEE